METNTLNPSHNNWLTIVGLILLLIPLGILMLWIGTFSSNGSASHADKVHIFFLYFPTFLRNTLSISLITVASAASSILFTLFGRKSADNSFRLVGLFVIIIASLVLLMQLFSML